MASKRPRGSGEAFRGRGDEARHIMRLKELVGVFDPGEDVCVRCAPLTVMCPS